MLHLRLVVPEPLVPEVLGLLDGHRGVVNLVHLPGAALTPRGHVVLCDVVREAANDVIEHLQDVELHRAGSIVIDRIDTALSDVAAAAEGAVPGRSGDALVWEEVEARARAESELNASFLVFISAAAVIAAVGILLDSPILIVGAMVVGPEYGPLAAVCVAAVRGRSRAAGRALTTVVAGFAVAVTVTFVAVVGFRAVGLTPDAFDLSDRPLTAFIAKPDGFSIVIAVVAGVVGMLSLTEARAGSLIGVFISVTTIPAAANIAVAAAFTDGTEAAGALAQLGLNLAGILLAGIATLAVQSRLTT